MNSKKKKKGYDPSLQEVEAILKRQKKRVKKDDLKIHLLRK